MHENRTKYPKKKQELYQRIKTLPEKYSVIALIRMEKVRSSQLLSLRKKLEDAIIISIKDRIARKAFLESNVLAIKNFVEYIKGQCVIIFTNISPFKLNAILSKNKIMLSSRGGDISSIDVIISSKNTGIAPGPILTDFKENSIPTKIDQGTIWITKETTPVKKGNIISAKLASILGKLDIKPIEASISLNAALENGIQYNTDELMIDIEKYSDEIINAHNKAIQLSIECGYTTDITITQLIMKSFNQANHLAIKLSYYSTNTIKQILINGYNNAKKIDELTNKE